ncbi:DUF3168 domain-containing protein [Mesorhizobium sp. M0830]|uniref:DUF3168 domain-containing protein n=1 Tax=Mesorhizobium sp. M0830 TaxID=2957008 RepID=UPI0033394282
MSASLDLQDLILNTLKADAPLMALINGVWDQPPSTAFAEPKQAYISFGPHDYVEDDDGCIVSGEHTFQLDAWSRLVGFPACKQIGDRVKAVLHEANLTMPTENALVEIRVPAIRYVRDSDGLTSHGIITVTALIEET